MSYQKRVWSETEKEIAYPSDFNRIENGIEVNDLEIAKQKNPTIPGTLAKQIADNVTAIEENTNKINVLNYQMLPSNITALSSLTGVGKWVCKENTQASNITDLPISDKSFSVENIPTVFNSNGIEVSALYILQRVTYYQPTCGVWIRYTSNGGATWTSWSFESGSLSKTYTELLNGWTLPWTSYKLNVSRSGSTVTIQGVLGVGTTEADTIIAELPEWAKSKSLNVIVTGINLTTVPTDGNALPSFRFRVSTGGKLIIQSANNLASGTFGINASYEGVDL